MAIVCCNCIEDESIAEEIRQQGTQGTCSFCNCDDFVTEISALAERIGETLEGLYEPGQEVPFSTEDSDNVQWRQQGSTLDVIIQEEIGASDKIASALTRAIIEWENPDPKERGIGFFNEDNSYERKSVTCDGPLESWENASAELKHQSRFFSESALAAFKSLFENFNRFARGQHWSPIVHIGPGTGTERVYRARRVSSARETIRLRLNPDIELGPPSKNLASPGRLNAAGIPVFYGAFERETCVAELRPPVGSQVVAVAFDILRPLKLLDISRLADVAAEVSIFHQDYPSLSELAEFYHRLERIVSKPIHPNDEMLAYVPTQALAEYLASVSPEKFDGVIYESAQVRGGKCICLFAKSSRIKLDTSIVRPKDEIDEFAIREGLFRDVLVIRKPQKKHEGGNERPLEVGELPNSIQLGNSDPLSMVDARPETLSCALNTVTIFEIESVEFEFSERDLVYEEHEIEDVPDEDFNDLFPDFDR